MPTSIRAKVWKYGPGQWSVKLNNWTQPSYIHRWPTLDSWEAAMFYANTEVKTARMERWQFGER